MKKVILVVFLVVAFSINSYAGVCTESDETGIVVDQNCESLLLLKTLLEDYAEYRRLNALNNDDANSSLKSFCLLTDQEEARRSEFLKMQERIGAEFTDLNVSFSIDSVNLSTEGNFLVAARELTEISYQYPGSIETDEMSFVTDHIMKISRDMFIVEDLYDEAFVFCQSKPLSEKSMLEIDESTKQDVVAINAISGYNTAQAIAYANTWWNSVNPIYHLEVNDCANFVSQCLYAGGVGFTNYGNYQNGWYAITNTNQNLSSNSRPWVEVERFDVVWHQLNGLTRQVVSGSVANRNKAIPGNPIYYLTPNSSSTGHLMIHVGYNSAGVPTVNAHNSSIYHVPTTNFEAHTLYSLEFKACSHYNIYESFKWLACFEMQ